MRTTVLVDNNGDMGLAGEWGLSVLIEREGKIFLLDTGASSLFLIRGSYPGSLIGGFHLVGQSERYIRDLCRRISNTGVERLITGHCTKEKGYRILRRELGDRVGQFRVGMKLEF